MKAKSFSLSPLLPYSSSLFFFLLLLPSSSLFLSAGLSQPKEADTEKSLLSLSLFLLFLLSFYLSFSTFYLFLVRLLPLCLPPPTQLISLALWEISSRAFPTLPFPFSLSKCRLALIDLSPRQCLSFAPVSCEEEEEGGGI